MRRQVRAPLLDDQFSGTQSLIGADLQGNSGKEWVERGVHHHRDVNLKTDSNASCVQSQST